jgi:predicted nucleic acid-binding protein
MVAPRLIAVLRENHEDIIDHWMDNCRGHLAEEFEQMLETPMGHSVASSMYNLALEYLEAEDYETTAILHRAHELAIKASYRRAAVGYSLNDIIIAAVAFRNAMQETLVARFHPANSDDEHALLQCIIRLTHLGDAFVAGRIAGFFSFSKFGTDDDDIAEAM